MPNRAAAADTILGNENTRRSRGAVAEGSRGPSTLAEDTPQPSNGKTLTPCLAAPR